MTDYKNAPRYPSHLAVAPHCRASHFGDTLAVAVAIGVMSAWAGYELGWEHRSDLAATEKAQPAFLGQCPTSTLDQDVIEHTWSHQGAVLHRECLIVSKPVFASPRYSQAPAM